MTFHWQFLVDFAVLASALYLVLRWAHETRAVRIALAIIALHLGALVARDYDLVITSWVLSAAGFLAIAVLLVVFQPELRHAFMRVDALLRGGLPKRSARSPVLRAVADAVFSLADARVGALIVLVRRDVVSELIQNGVTLGAQVSRQLLEAVFQKSSPLHDGAVVLDGSTLTRANAVLPLTIRGDVPAYFGTRHRAAMGLAERSDALVIVVSEQRGIVSLMEDRGFTPMRTKEELLAVFENLDEGRRLPLPARIRRSLASNLRYKFAALALAAAVWGLTIQATGASVYTVTAGVEFNGVPAGMDIANESASLIEVQLRGNPWLLDSASLSRLTANFDLHAAKPGQVTLAVGPENFNLPPGIVLNRASPRVVTVRLVRRER